MVGPILRVLALSALLIAVPGTLIAQQDAADPDAQPATAQSDSQSSAASASNHGPRIYPQLAASLIERGVPVIDVRSVEEVEETGMIGNAVNIPHTDLQALMDFIGEDSDRAVVMYCGSGRRVGLAIEELRQRDFHGMVNAGGYDDLQEALETLNEQE